MKINYDDESNVHSKAIISMHPLPVPLSHGKS